MLAQLTRSWKFYLFHSMQYYCSGHHVSNTVPQLTANLSLRLNLNPSRDIIEIRSQGSLLPTNKLNAKQPLQPRKE